MVTRTDQPASIGRRIAATILDGLVVLVIWAVAWLAIRDRVELDVASVASINAAIAAIYEVMLIALLGQTVGKAAVGIAIVNMWGENPTASQSVLRYIAKTLIPLGLISRWFGARLRIVGALTIQAWQILLVVSIVTNGRRQGVHDRVGRTCVVYVKPRDPVPSEADTARSLTRRLSRHATPVPLVTVDRIRKRRISRRR